MNSFKNVLFTNTIKKKYYYLRLIYDLRGRGKLLGSKLRHRGFESRRWKIIIIIIAYKSQNSGASGTIILPNMDMF